jgi:hypothetical protein
VVKQTLAWKSVFYRKPFAHKACWDEWDIFDDGLARLAGEPRSPVWLIANLNKMMRAPLRMSERKSFSLMRKVDAK